MGPIAFILHLLNFVAPALVVGALLAVLAPWALRGGRGRYSWLVQTAFNAAAGTLALLGGLWYFGNDGKMATYIAMLVLSASCQWACMAMGRSGRAG